MAKAAGRSAAPKVRGEEGGWLGGLLVLAGIVLLVGGGGAFVFCGDVAAPREGVLVGAAVAAGLGMASLGYYFHRWGRL